MILSLEKSTASAPSKVGGVSKRKATIDTARADREAEPRLLDLVRLRVLQIHGCKESIQEQTTSLKAQGETDQRLRLLDDWRNRAIFSDYEEAALNLAEGLTYNPIDAVPDQVVHVARFFFSETETIRLTLAVLAVNDWYYLNDRAAEKRNEPTHAQTLKKIKINQSKP
jgi:alkylhydroperoxidase family enzyme